MRLGTLLDARDVAGFLDVSKQRVSTLTRQGRLVVMSAEGGLRYPAWQFAGLSPEQRGVLAAAHRRLVEVGGIDPWSAADWATQAHPDLEGADPVAWLRDDGDCELLLTVAQRDAARAAQ